MKRIGGYQILEKLPPSGEAEVYVARQESLDRLVVLKIYAGQDAKTIDRFHLEAAAMARLDHPSLARVFDHGSEGGAFFLAMELVEGETLATWRARSEAELARRLAEICAGVDHLHSQGLIHRNLRPEHIVVDGAGRARLVEFCLARYGHDQSLTRQEEKFGSNPFGSPEWRRGESLDLRTDIFSLGKILEAGAGKNRSRGMSRIIERATQDTADLRFVRAGDMAAALLAFAMGQPVWMGKPTWRERAGGWIRRRPLAAAGALLALILGSAAGASYLRGQETVSKVSPRTLDRHCFKILAGWAAEKGESGPMDPEMEEMVEKMRILFASYGETVSSGRSVSDDSH